jgi:hypothetical protein
MEDLGGGHLTALERAAYLDRGLSADDSRRVEAHLAACELCRRQLTEESQLVRGVRRKRRPAVAMALIASAAAVILIASRVPRHSNTAPLRAEPALDSTTVPLVAYGPIGEQRSGVRRFVWASANGALSYRLTVSSSDGTVLWSTSVTDTSATLPDTISLSRAPKYFWVADAILRDGRTRSTGLHEFSTSP